MAITTQPHYFHNGFPALSSPPPRPPPYTPLSYHLLKCINSSEINSLLYDAVSAYVMIFVQKMGESESGFSFAFGSQPLQWRWPQQELRRNNRFLSFLLVLLSKSSKKRQKWPSVSNSCRDHLHCHCGSFFGDPKDLNKFQWSRTKIRGTLYWWVGLPNHPKTDENGLKMTKMPISQNSLVARFSIFL